MQWWLQKYGYSAPTVKFLLLPAGIAAKHRSDCSLGENTSSLEETEWEEILSSPYPVIPYALHTILLKTDLFNTAPRWQFALVESKFSETSLQFKILISGI